MENKDQKLRNKNYDGSYDFIAEWLIIFCISKGFILLIMVIHF